MSSGAGSDQLDQFRWTLLDDRGETNDPKTWTLSKGREKQKVRAKAHGQRSSGGSCIMR